MAATAMSANVFFWISPGQRTVVAVLKAGQPFDPIRGLRGKQRSVHNTSFTLPVLFAMFSIHFSFTKCHPQSGGGADPDDAGWGGNLPVFQGAPQL